MKWQLLMDVNVVRGSSSCALFSQQSTQEQTLYCNQVLEQGTWGSRLLFEALRTVYFSGARAVRLLLLLLLL